MDRERIHQEGQETGTGKKTEGKVGGIHEGREGGGGTRAGMVEREEGEIQCIKEKGGARKRRERETIWGKTGDRDRGGETERRWVGECVNSRERTRARDGGERTGSVSERKGTHKRETGKEQDRKGRRQGKTTRGKQEKGQGQTGEERPSEGEEDSRERITERDTGVVDRGEGVGGGGERERERMHESGKGKEEGGTEGEG